MTDPSYVEPDPFTLEIIRDGLQAASDEMFIALGRAAQGIVIYECLDYCVGIADASGRMVVQGNGVPLFIGTLESAVREVIDKFGTERDMEPGDIFAMNDPYRGGGTHTPDVCLVMPVFADDELIAFTANKGHWSELGGKVPGTIAADSTEVFQEGLQIPIVKLFRRSEPVQAILDLLAINVRLPRQTLGDMWASVAAARIGERRIRELYSKYGHAAWRQAVDGLLDYAESMSLAALSHLPKGTFEAEDWIDDDGITDNPIPVRCKVTISDKEFVADFTGTSGVVAGPFNTGWAGLESGVKLAFKALTDPASPANHGAFRPLRIVCPPDTILSARRPAATGKYHQAVLFATEVIWKALAPHCPKRLPAGHLAAVCGTTLIGRDPASGDVTLLQQPLVGGWGATADRDGENGQFCAADGETFNIPIEVQENKFGVLVEQYAFHDDDGGAGERRGGKGVVLDYRVVDERIHFSGDYGRHKFRPWGIAGGSTGTASLAQIARADGSTEARQRAVSVPVNKGERIRLVTPTGGGYGDPRSRPRQKVLEDLKNGYITREQARRDYGVEVEE